jgi:hypothetical protein
MFRNKKEFPQCASRNCNCSPFKRSAQFQFVYVTLECKCWLARELRFSTVTNLPVRSNTRISLGVLRYFFNAGRTGRVTAFASDLRLLRSGIAARFTTVFFATFHDTGAGNVGTNVFLGCCHKVCSIRRECKERSPLYRFRTVRNSVPGNLEK